MEYGALERRGEDTMFDVDPAPIFRMVAAALWRTPCRDQHIAEVAGDSMLTVQTIACAVVAYLEGNGDAVTALGLSESGAGAVIAALQREGMESAGEVVDEMSTPIRKTALVEVVDYLNYGFVALHLDLGARFKA